MKNKFEDNVASKTPKTRVSREPALPWKVDETEMAQVASTEEDYKSTVKGLPPFRTRAIFLVLLLVSVFGAILYYSSIMALDNEEARSRIQRKDKAISSMRAELNKIAMENTSLNESVTRFKARVDLYTSVIESLTKKMDEPQAGTKEAVEEPRQKSSWGFFGN